jgi:DNA-binding transcriptional ArsR family regulator
MNDNRSSALDRVLQTAGAERLRQGFAALAAANRREALRLLEDEKLRFPAFFTVLPEIQAYKLTDELGSRNFAAVTVCTKKLRPYDTFASQAGYQDGETLREALLWMFGTGKDWDAPAGERASYDAVLDYAAALLVMTFEETSVMKDIAGLIFRRHRRGRLIHDLVWCFFQTLDHDALVRVAGNLLSTDIRDVTLACSLLGLEAPASPGTDDVKSLHSQYVGWLKENRPYLYVTGEHFQQTGRPKHLSVDLEAKYLGKALSPRYRAPVEPLSAHETACLHEYRGFPPEEQELLSDYSHLLRRWDARAWEAWIQKQVAEQVIAAKSGVEAV